MFNKQANQHKENQLLNPFSGETGRRSPKPTFSKDEYGKWVIPCSAFIPIFLWLCFFRPLAGSLTEARGQKANIHVLREMLELCQIIDSEGYVVKDEPTMRVIPFGELFNVSLFFDLLYLKALLKLSVYHRKNIDCKRFNSFLNMRKKLAAPTVCMCIIGWERLSLQHKTYVLLTFFRPVKKREVTFSNLYIFYLWQWLLFKFYGSSNKQLIFIFRSTITFRIK